MTVESVRLKIDLGLKLHVNIEHRRDIARLVCVVNTSVIRKRDEIFLPLCVTGFAIFLML